MVVSTLGANDLRESRKLPATVGQLLDHDEIDRRSVEISDHTSKGGHKSKRCLGK